MIDSGTALIVAAAVTSVPASLAGFGAWRAATNNASQESVDILHDCLNKHTEQDEANFLALDARMDEGDQQRKVFTRTLARLEAALGDKGAE